MVVDQQRKADDHDRADDRHPYVAVAVTLYVKHQQQAHKEQQFVLDDRHHDIICRRHLGDHAVRGKYRRDQVAYTARRAAKRREKAHLLDPGEHRRADDEVGNVRKFDRVFGMTYRAIVAEFARLVEDQHRADAHRDDVGRAQMPVQPYDQSDKPDGDRRNQNRKPPILHQFSPFVSLTALRSAQSFLNR